ncbi:MAG: nitrilase-related carbon-nitrogen hydrolase [Nocardioides sp.]
MELIVGASQPSLSRVHPPERGALRVGLVQHRWRSEGLADVLLDAIGQAAEAGAQIVFLPEITLIRYPADIAPTAAPGDTAEDLQTGPTMTLARAAATRFGIHVHASLYEKVEGPDGLGFNTAVLLAPDGRLVGRTRKTHIPITAGYHEDKFFRAGPARADGQDPYPVHEALGARLGLPTCWDEWFPEVARAYGLAGADILAYPTAIGSEPDHPDFDTEPLWRAVITGHAIANGLFIVVPNRTGAEGLNTFYGSSFIVDPYGRLLVQAPRETEAVLVADLDLDQRRDWLDLFPFFTTRRPDTYGPLIGPA